LPGQPTDDDDDDLFVSSVEGDEGNVGQQVQGQFGTLVVNADGTFSYTLNNNNSEVDDLNDGEELFERPEENPFLERFYGDMPRFALATQLTFLFQRADQLRQLAQLDMFRQPTVSDFLLDKDPLFARLNLSDDEYTLYEKVYRHLKPQTATPGGRPVTQISEALAYLERHYTEPVTVEDVAEAVGTSPTSLHRMFREIVGRPPIDYLIHLRIEKAAQLLRRGGLRVGEVSGAVGFNDSNYFARQFRSVTGRTPREYAKG